MLAASNLDLVGVELLGNKIKLALRNIGVVVAPNQGNLVLVGFDFVPLPGLVVITALLFQIVAKVCITR